MSSGSNGPGGSGSTPLTVGPWTILHEINEGGMARVALAERSWGTGEKKVAVLKMPKAEYLLDAKKRKWFFDEAKTALKLDHPNIVPVFDAGVDEGLPYMAMTFVAGRDLAATILAATQRSIEIDPELAGYVTLQVAYALQYAHEFEIDGVCQQIVHRDVAAKNVMVSGKGAVQLTDFGVASALSIETSTNTVKGTLPYMAPEHALGHASSASDCFGLGTILWSLLEGRKMRHNVERADLLAAAVRGYVTPLTRQGIPAELRKVVDGLLDPTERTRMTLAQAIPILEESPGRRTALSKLMTRLFGRDASRSGHTRIDAPIPEQIRMGIELARSQHRRESDDSPVAGTTRDPATSSAANTAEPTADYGPDYRAGTPSEVREVEADAPRVFSHKRRRTSTTNTALGPQTPAATEPTTTPTAKPGAKPGDESRAIPRAEPSAEVVRPADQAPERPSVATWQAPPRSSGMLRVLVIGFGSGTLIAAVVALVYLGTRAQTSDPPTDPPTDPPAELAAAVLEPGPARVRAEDPVSAPPTPPGTASPSAAADAPPTLSVAAPAEPRAPEAPEAAPPHDAQAPTVPTDPPGKSASADPKDEAPADPSPAPATKTPAPATKTPARAPASDTPSATPKTGPKVDVTLGLGFVSAAEVRLGGRTYKLSRARPSIAIRVPQGSRTLRWRVGGGEWHKRSWNLKAGCRHVAMFESKAPRLSSKCTSPR